MYKINVFYEYGPKTWRYVVGDDFKTKEAAEEWIHENRDPWETYEIVKERTMKYFVNFGDVDREDADFFPYSSRWFDSYESAKAWAEMLDPAMETEIVGYDESTNCYEVM